jgi:hypothetical protein
MMRPSIRTIALCASTLCTISAAPTIAPAATCPNATFRVGSSTLLPDCRAFEQVSPVNKDGYDAVSRLSFLQYPAQASPSGAAIEYQSNNPSPDASSSLFPNARISVRTRTGGWETSELTPPTPQATLPVGISAAQTEYNFSTDLSRMVVKVPGEALTPLPPGNEGLFNLFLRNSDEEYSLLNSAAPSEFAPEGDECHTEEACFQVFDVVEFAGASSDFTHLFLETNDSLVGTGAPGGFVNNLYENVNGKLHLVGILPDGQIAPTGSVAGAGGGELVVGEWTAVNHAISSDGRRAVFESVADNGGPEPAQAGLPEIYDRLNGTKTVEVSAPAAGAIPANSTSEPAQFWDASTDGSFVFFTSSAELTTGSNTGPTNNSADLYRYDVSTGALTDLTIDTNPVDAATGAGVEGVVGTSTDGSYIYFVAEGQLTGNQGVSGQPNLYVWHEDTRTHEAHLGFIATLSGGDFHDWTSRLFERQSYVTPDGRHLAFMSLNSLTGYDNTDHTNHTPYSEVYEYDADVAALVCASCNSDGAPAVGSAFIGATPEHLASTAFYQPRVLSDDGGRLFFSSKDPLVNNATSGISQIYEYERNGTGTCKMASNCVYLISTGAPNVISTGEPVEDLFLDADATGENVFIATLARLAASDSDSLFDIYDARVDGGFALAPQPINCAGCTTASTQQPSTPPASENIVGGVPTTVQVNVSSHRKTSQKLSCRAKAKKIRKAKSRIRALARCHKTGRVSTKSRKGR